MTAGHEIAGFPGFSYLSGQIRKCSSRGRGWGYSSGRTRGVRGGRVSVKNQGEILSEMGANFKVKNV